MTVVLKLGGSVITEKTEPETIDAERSNRVVTAIADADIPDLVVVHGGGSFGHHHASERGISTTTGSHDAPGVLAVHRAMKRLNDAVIDRLHDRRVPAVPVHPFSAGHRDAQGSLHVTLAQARTMLDEGFVPVSHGDVIVHRRKGVTVVSGDELVVALAEGLAADAVGLCSTTAGVLDEAGAVIPEIDEYEAVADVLGESETTDVTGGMATKVRTLLDLDAPAAVFGPEDVAAFLAGEEPGTTVRG